MAQSRPRTSTIDPGDWLRAADLVEHDDGHEAMVRRRPFPSPHLSETQAGANDVSGVGAGAAGFTSTSDALRSIVHDFNNLVGAIHAYAELLGMTELDATQHRYVREIQGAAEDAGQLAHRLGDCAPVVITPFVSLNEVVKRVGRMLAPVLPRGIELSCLVDPMLEAVRGDPAKLERTVLDLALDARDAMPFEGTLTIACAEALVCDGCDDGMIAGRYAVLRVSDTGPGDEKEITTCSFDPSLSAFVKVWSKPNKGTTTEIYVPCARA